ncbi:regulatory-associated protein of mTOR isoform X3 [Histomonas meleagridis]|uniref:regulatory-associated protein of mTOR isoform X3 n=1 Tax=Histomonas meleagridis TaxID=135588 RepID=UPI00355A4B15|nr:regulatory-associated protein of mTOR isoform X3 [Histomonas meleagridis]KAH0806317.1 regulatory-associated protein of mTOR isoform X3 [Histomonas meleagridis]
MRRVNRFGPQISLSKRSPPTSKPVNKTKHVVCFLCLFDGLRTPSIRRLVRKPQIVCQRPLVSFDPSYYSPSSQKAFPELYKSTINCQCSIVVDPSVETVQCLLESYACASPYQRLIIHYYGQGTHVPLSDGSLYFFTQNRSRYKSLKITKLIGQCYCPICLIFDCPYAGVLAPYVAECGLQKDIFAFFACSDNEELPYSTIAPLDLFSSCLLKPYDTAIWWHIQRHASVLGEHQIPEEYRECLSPFLDAILDAIAFETQTPKIYESYTLDPTIAHLFRGFLLAQRVMFSFNKHCSAYPNIEFVTEHLFWHVWDIAVDFCLNLTFEKALQKLFDLCMGTFKTFSSPGVFAIYTYFIKTERFSEKAAETLFDFLDQSSIETLNAAASSSLSKSLLNMNKLSEKCLLILAKLMVSDISNNFSSMFQTSFCFSKKPEILMGGMLNLCCIIGSNNTSQFNQIATSCCNFAEKCAPLSALLLGLILEKAGDMVMLHTSNLSCFVNLLKSNRNDIRTCTVFLLGATHDMSYYEKLVEMENDINAYVREQVVYALRNLINNENVDKEIINEIRKMEMDENEIVKNAVENALSSIANGTEVLNPISQYLVKSVRMPGFAKRYQENVIGI